MSVKKLLKRAIKTLSFKASPLFATVGDRAPYIFVVLVALLIVVGGINIFIELTDTLSMDTLKTYDQQITDYVLSFRTPTLTKYFLYMTYLGDIYGYLLVLGIYLGVSIFVFKKGKYIAQTFLVLLLATVSNMVLKRFVDRARPGIEHLVSVETLSYPSGHAMSSMAFYGFLIYLSYNLKIKKIHKAPILISLAIIILSIGLSRIYLGAHYPSDNVGGYIAGAIWVIFCIVIFDIIEIYKNETKV